MARIADDRHPIDLRYADGYRWEPHADVAVTIMIGDQSRTYIDVARLTRLPDHPRPDRTPPAVILAKSDTTLVVVELWDHRVAADPDGAVVDLADARRRRGQHRRPGHRPDGSAS